MDQFGQWITYGGMMLIPIAIASLLGVALIVGKWLSLRRGRVIPERLRRSVVAEAKKDRWKQAEKLCGGDSSALGRVLGDGLRFRGASRREIRAAMEEVGRREVSRLERYIGAVGALASVTPLMGLLGTVIGMIRVFQVVVDDAAEAGITDPTLLAGGIWEALVTTAAGLGVAIPLYLGYRYLLGSLETRAVNLEEAAGELLDELAPPPIGRRGKESEGALAVSREREEERRESDALATEGA